MNRLPKQYQDGDMPSPRSSRAPSISSDRPSNAGSASTIAAVYVPPAASVTPSPAYVAVSAASQIVTDHQNATLLDELSPEEADTVPAESARFSEEALSLLNGFLDSLLYSVLATGRSPSLTTIRPAVQEVLKPRLAREAMRAADEELSGLLAGDEDEEFPEGQRPKWNLEAVFKRTRLRIMVYTRLGELEDEDEERFLAEDDSLAVVDEDEEGVRDAGLVSWAAAIFLTSVIEYIAEQTLIIAGQAAFNRVRGKRKRNGPAQGNGNANIEDLERVIVQEFDMEKVALNSTLGRLWRTWKKSLRAPTTPLSASARTSFYRSGSIGSQHRRYSTGNAHDAPSAAALEDVPEVEHSETDIAANIPLPIGDNDVAEIEVPGLAKSLDEEAGGSGAQTPVVRPVKQRPMSWLAAPGSGRHLLRNRSNSMPSLKAVAAEQTSQEDVSGTTPPFMTPAEYVTHRDDYIGETGQIPTLEEERDREDISSVIAETGSLPGAASPPPGPIRPKSMLRERSPRPLALGRDAVASAEKREVGRVTIPPREKKDGTSSKRATEKAQSDDSRARKMQTPESEVIGLAKTSDVPVAAPPSPLTQEAEDAAAHKEKRQARRLSASPPIARNNVSSSAEALAPKDAVREESRPSSGSSKQTPPMDSLKDSEIDNKTNSRSFRSQTVSTQASQTIPTGPPSVSAMSSQTRDSSTSRKSHDSSRSYNRNRSATANYEQDRATLQRVSSVSSANTSILHTSRGSESSIAFNNRRPINSRMSEEDRARDFDAAIAQADTVYYTLTPERMREVNKENAREKAAAEAQEKSGAQHNRSATQVTVYPRVVHSSSGSQGLQRSNSSSKVSTTSKQGKSPESEYSDESKASRPTPINQVGNVYSRNKYLPREPRVQTDPTFDLRDFLLSTTPAGGSKNSVKPIETSFSSQHSISETSPTPTPTGSRGFLSKSTSRSAKTSISDGSSSSPVTRDSMGKKPPKKHLEPRSPAGPSHIDNDLIDLIRQGPPGQGGRIPRSVAPFRDTMDSDQMELYASTVAPSVISQHTTNSRSGLLAHSSNVQPAYSNEPSTLSGSLADMQPTIVKNRPKKRLDPYAIPDDDDLEEEFEDEDELTALPGSTSGPFTNMATPPAGGAGISIMPSSASNTSKPKARTGTSDLADFLSSEAPSRTAADAPVQPFVLSESTLKAIKSGNSATAASANGIRSASSGKPPSSKGSTAAGGSTGASLSAGSMTTTTITAGNGASGRLGTSGSTTSSLGRRGGTLRQTGARDARMDREERGGLNEMADFLKNSGPPPSMDEKPLPFLKLGKNGTPVEPGKEKRSLRFWKR